MSSAICFNLDQSRILSSGNWLKDFCPFSMMFLSVFFFKHVSVWWGLLLELYFYFSAEYQWLTIERS